MVDHFILGVILENFMFDAIRIIVHIPIYNGNVDYLCFGIQKFELWFFGHTDQPKPVEGYLSCMSGHRQLDK